MSTKTTNYNFVKPALTDPADITAQNANWDTVDAELKTISDDIEGIASESLPYFYNNIQVIQNTLPGLQKKITYGTAAPSGGNPGDVYIQIID